MNHIITVSMDAFGRITVDGLVYQYNHGHIIQMDGFRLPDGWYLDLANSESGKAVSVRGSGNRAVLPDELLLTGNNVHCWLVSRTETEQFTKHHFVLHVIRRAELPER